MPRYFVTPANELRQNSQYRGEAYTVGGTGSASIPYLSPSRIVVRVRTMAPDTVVVNQNYDHRWRVTPGTITSHKGLLAAELPEAGDHELTFRYIAFDCYLGIALSAFTLLGAVLVPPLARACCRPRAGVCTSLARHLARYSDAEAALPLQPRSLLRPRPLLLIGCTSIAVGILWMWRVRPILTTDRLIREGERLVAARDFAAAAQKYRSAQERSPNRKRPRASLGLCHLAQGDYGSAAAILEEVTRLWPDDPMMWSFLSRARQRQGRTGDAVLAASSAIGLTPYDANAHYALASRLTADGQVEEAVRALARAVELGLDGLEAVQTSPEFAAIRKHPAFLRLLQATQSCLPPGSGL